MVLRRPNNWRLAVASLVTWWVWPRIKQGPFQCWTALRVSILWCLCPEVAFCIFTFFWGASVRSGSDLHDQHNTSKQLPSVVLCGKHDFSFLLQPLCNPMHEFTEEPELLSNRTAFFLHKSNLLLTLLSSATLNVSKALPSAGHRTTSSQKKQKNCNRNHVQGKMKEESPEMKAGEVFFCPQQKSSVAAVSLKLRFYL